MTARFSRIVLLISTTVLGVACSAFRPTPSPRAQMPSWSPDGERIVFVCFEDGPTMWGADTNVVDYAEEAAEICIINRDGTNKVRLTRNQIVDRDPKWSPDGTMIAYGSDEGLFTYDLQSNTSKHLFGRGYVSDPNWSPDSRFIAFVACRNGMHVYIVDREGQFKQTVGGTEEKQTTDPRWSPDGRYVAFSSQQADPTCIGGSQGAVSDIMIADAQNTASTRVVNELVKLGQIMWIDQTTLAYSIGIDYSAVLYKLNVKDHTISEVKLSGVPGRVRTYAWSPTATSFAYATNDGLYVQDLLSNQTSFIWKPRGDIFQMEWSPDGRYIVLDMYEDLLSSGSSYTVTIWLIKLADGSAKRLMPQ